MMEIISCPVLLCCFLGDDGKLDDLSWRGWPWISTSEFGKTITGHSQGLHTVRIWLCTDKWTAHSRSELTNLWRACPKWHVKRFPWQAAFPAAVPFFKFLLPDQRLYIVKNMCVYIQMSDCSEMCINYRGYQIILQVKHLYRNREWCEVLTIFIIEAPAWR